MPCLASKLSLDAIWTSWKRCEILWLIFIYLSMQFVEQLACNKQNNSALILVVLNSFLIMKLKCFFVEDKDMFILHIQGAMGIIRYGILIPWTNVD